MDYEVDNQGQLLYISTMNAKQNVNAPGLV